MDIVLWNGVLIGALEGMGGVVKHNGTKAKEVLYVTVPVPSPMKAYNWAEVQVDKKYDYSACIWGFITRSDWFDDEDKWFCSELASKMLVVGGLSKPLVGGVNRISPTMLLQMLSWVPGVQCYTEMQTSELPLFDGVE